MSCLLAVNSHPVGVCRGHLVARLRPAGGLVERRQPGAVRLVGRFVVRRSCADLGTGHRRWLHPPRPCCPPRRPGWCGRVCSLSGPPTPVSQSVKRKVVRNPSRCIAASASLSLSLSLSLCFSPSAASDDAERKDTRTRLACSPAVSIARIQYLHHSNERTFLLMNALLV